jgi:hypothetical protein
MKRITIPITLDVPDDEDPEEVRHEVHSVVYTYLNGEPGLDEWRVI